MGAYQWINDGLQTTFRGGGVISIDQERKTYERHFRAPNSDWPRFLAVVLQYAHHVGQEIPRPAKRTEATSDISDLFIPRVPAVVKGDRADAPTLGNSSGRLYTVYIIGRTLHFGINLADRQTGEKQESLKKPDIFIVRGGLPSQQFSWLSFKPGDVPHLMNGIGEFYPDRARVRAIINYFIRRNGKV